MSEQIKFMEEFYFLSKLICSKHVTVFGLDCHADCIEREWQLEKNYVFNLTTLEVAKII